ncbi:hypothetical protein [Streptacidiphilus anmyonensis]|uniref:hypothetical protein n=1 Tax=Streptacidiphilus anmyonensis TaxID=405782 RepID=UPI001F4846F3|nr:hypothetical protein [Streptacidiphilus anmyonensis]
MHVFAALFAPAPTPVPAQGSVPIPAEHVGTMAWLLPVLLGLLLTAIACYKHRGLPGGH